MVRSLPIGDFFGELYSRMKWSCRRWSEVPRLYLRSMKKALIQLHIAVFLAGFTAILGKFIT
ncbi:MAG: hypothetical protein WBO39_15925, partial [Ferruginibacter sp.]